MPNFEELVQPADLDKNIAGTAQGHFYIPYKDISSMPSPGSSTAAELVTLSGQFTLGPGKKWFPMYSTLDTGRVTDKLVGEEDGKSWEHVFEWFYPGTEAQAMGLISMFANHRMAFIATEANGQRRMIGNATFPARLTMAEIDTDLKTAGRKGIKLKVESRGPRPAPIVPADIVIILTPEDQEN